MLVAYPMTTPPKFGAVTETRKESATPAGSVATRPPVAHAGSDRRGRSPLQLHFRCFAVWEQERHRPPSHSSPRGASHSSQTRVELVDEAAD